MSVQDTICIVLAGVVVVQAIANWFERRDMLDRVMAVHKPDALAALRDVPRQETSVPSTPADPLWSEVHARDLKEPS
jgi:hypothetical protein